MRQLLGFTICFILMGSSCKKDEIQNPPAELIGNWEWRYTHMGWEPGPMNPLTPENTGNTEMMVFEQNFSWKSFVNGIPTDSGTFRIGHGSYSPSEYTTYTYDSIQYYRNGMMVKGLVDYYKIQNDTLIFSLCFRGFYGCSSKTYIKKYN